jgi:tetrahydrodipicolinate N-succinyltransferase
MFQAETLPQSMVEVKTIVLKPRLDKGDIELIGEKIKPRLFSRFGFKPRPENIRLICSELYFEPYLLIGGKYVLDYCKKHVFEIDVKERTNNVFVGGQEFRSEKSDPNRKSKIIKLSGEEHAHHERKTYFVLDRMKREISPEKLPIAPFNIQKENSQPPSYFKRIHIPDEIQIDFLKRKIAERPYDVAEIIKETFDITDRIIIYCPIYQLTFENMKNKTAAAITINGITGEIALDGNKKLTIKTIVVFPESIDIQPTKVTTYNEAQTKAIPKAKPPRTTDNTNSAVKEQEQIQPSESEDEEIFYGDMEIPSGTTINKILVVKGSLKIGDNCRIHGKFKALKDITVGSDTIIDGDLISGGNVFVGARSLIAGSVEASGVFEIEETAIVEGVNMQNAPNQ